MTQEQIKQIRELLDHFYQGATTPEEERQLASLLQNAEDLPADLEADRRLFASLSADIPTETANRIENALEAEMAKARSPFTSRRRRWAIAGVAAACLAIASVGVSLLIPDKDISSQPNQEQLANVKTPSVNVEKENAELPARDSLISAPIAQNIEATAPVPIVKPKEAKAETRPVMQKSTEKEANQVAETLPGERTRDKSYDHLAANYRIIDDPQEAQAFVGELFAVMESNLVLERSRVADVYDNMQFELTNCSMQLQ